MDYNKEVIVTPDPIEDDDKALLDLTFDYHAPSPEKVVRHQLVRNACKELGVVLLSYCPGSEELDLAMNKVEEAMMWANAAIAREE